MCIFYINVGVVAEGPALLAAVRKQVEFYFSRANLANDAYLVSQMNNQMFVPIKVILSFGKLKGLTEDANVVKAALADSKVRMCAERGVSSQPWLPSGADSIWLLMHKTGEIFKQTGC